MIYSEIFPQAYLLLDLTGLQAVDFNRVLAMKTTFEQTCNHLLLSGKFWGSVQLKP